MRIRRGLFLAAALASISVAALVAIDVRTPSEVPWTPARLQGLAAERADGLVLQHEDGRDVWASQGYALYRSRASGPFVRVMTLRPRFGEAYGGYSRTLRRRFGYQELVELLPLGGDHLVAFAGGDVYRVDVAQGSQERVHSLRYFGRGEGRGVLAHGLTRDAKGSLYYGEYPTGSGKPDRTVRVWRSDDEGRSWQTAYEFPTGAVRHVHGVQSDPYGSGVWVGTGDADDRSMLGYSADGARSFHWVGRGSQEFRVVSVLFLRDVVAWAMDADTRSVGTLRWRRADGAIERGTTTLPGPGYFAQAVDETRGLVGLAELDASLWLFQADAEPRGLLQWTLPSPPRPGPHPGVRLARGALTDRRVIHVNPLRTVEDEAAIYRLPLSVLDAPR